MNPYFFSSYEVNASWKIVDFATGVCNALPLEIIDERGVEWAVELNASDVSIHWSDTIWTIIEFHGAILVLHNVTNWLIEWDDIERARIIQRQFINNSII